MHRLVRLLSLVFVALIATGCTTTAGTGDDAEPYRTIRVEPGRNTDEARRQNQIGLDHLERGDLIKASDAFGKALAADVEYGPAHNNLGKVYFKQADWYKAAWEFEYARKLMPKHAEPCNNLALVLEQAGELDRAVILYREATVLDGSIEYRGNLTRALIRRGERTDEVRNLLQQIIQEDSRTDWVMWARQQHATMGGGKNQ